MLLTAGGLYVVLANGLVSSWLLGNLENQYPALKLIDRSKKVGTIVVLSSYAKIDSDRPISSEVNEASGFRIMEAFKGIQRYFEG